MLDFRKVLLALSVAGLGLVSTASAQVPTCTTAITAGQFEGYVAVEGVTENLPSLDIVCTNSGAFTGPVTFVLTASVPFTNQSLTTGTKPVDATITDTSANTVSSITQPGPTTIQFTFNTVTALATQTYTVAGLKVNASVAPVSSTITLSVSSPSVQVSGTAVNMAFVSKSLSTIAVAGAANVSACTGAALATTNNAVASVTVTGGFPDSMKALAEITGASGVAALQGTRFAVTFNNLNTAGVNYYVPNTIAGTNVTVNAYAAGSGGAALAGATINGTAGLVLLTVNSGGSATIYYGVATDTPTGTQSFVIPIVETVPSVAAVTAYSTASVTASATLVGVAAPGYPQYSASQTAYTSTGPGATPGLFTPCATTLLFPYVTNVQGYDTGIAITNAGTGSGIPGLTAGSGSCVVTFYGAGAPTTTYNTGTIATGSAAAGNTAAFLLSSQAPGVTGYAVSVCNFLGAHGYAFIFSGAGSSSFSTADYLAIVTTSGAAALPLPTF